MTKYLFLDVDGVLNHSEYLSYSSVFKYPYCWFDPVCVERVKEILNKTGAKLVISSSWRNDSNLSHIFNQVGLPSHFDVTPVLLEDDVELARGLEIAEYLQSQNNPEHVYAILDDDIYDLTPEQLQYTIHCEDGLTQDLTQKAIQLLNNGRTI